jgi:eukaryotic-like serine/threonine-protein kinase
MEYVKWFSNEDEFAYRLPTSVEWEAAATGGGSRVYPWGSDPIPGRCNICDRSCRWLWRDSSVNDHWAETAPVGSFPACAGPEKVFDLIGNVAEWSSIPGTNRHDLRGGSWAAPQTLNDPRSPNLKPSQFSDATTGFRLAASAFDLTAFRKRLEKGDN